MGDRGERVKGNEVEKFADGRKGTDFIGIYNHAKNYNCKQKKQSVV